MKSSKKTLGVLLLLSMCSARSFSDEISSEISSCIKSGSAYTSTMNSTQRKELFVRGTITDCKDKVWDIVLIPGSDKSKTMTVKALKRSGDLIVENTTHLAESRTYYSMGRNIKRLFEQSNELSSEGVSRIKEGVVDDAIIEGIAETMFMKTGKDWMNGFISAGRVAADGNFGWSAGAVYAGLIKPLGKTFLNVGEAVIWHVTLKGGSKLIWGTVETVTGGVGMVISPVVSPGYEIIFRPLGALTISVIDTVVIGGVTSGAVFVWNGTSWTLSQLSDVPTRESSIGSLDLVELKFNPHAAENQVHITNIEFAIFSKMLQAQIKNIQVEHAKIPIGETINDNKDKIKQLKAQIKGLEKNNNDLKNQKKKLSYDYRSDPTVKATEELIASASNADEIMITDEIKLVIKDMKALKRLVLETSNEMGVKVSDEEAEGIVKETVKTFNTNFVHNLKN